MFYDPQANEDEEEDKFFGFTASDVHQAEDKLWSIMGTGVDLKYYFNQCANLENERAVFAEPTDPDIVTQITEDECEFKQIHWAAEMASS